MINEKHLFKVLDKVIGFDEILLFRIYRAIIDNQEYLLKEENEKD